MMNVPDEPDLAGRNQPERPDEPVTSDHRDTGGIDLDPTVHKTDEPQPTEPSS